MADDIFVQGSQKAAQIVPTGHIEGAENAQKGANLGISTLQQSQQQQEADAMNIAIPSLPIPNFEILAFVSSSSKIDLDTFQFTVNEELNKACISMLDKWNDSIKEEADRRRKIDSDPNEIRKNEEKLKFTQVVDAYGHSANVKEDAFIPIMTVGLLFASNSLSSGLILDTPGMDSVGASAKRNDQANFFASYPSDMRAELGLLGAAMLQGSIYLAVAETFGAEGKKVKGGGDQETAEHYAQSVIDLVTKGTLTSMITAIVTQNLDPSTKADPKTVAKHVETAVKSVKIVLLMTALAALYAQGKGGTERITGQELQGLLDKNNKTFGPNQGKMDELIAMIQQEIGNSEDYATLLNAIYNFVDKNNSLAVLTNPSKVMANLMPFFSRSPLYEQG